MESTETNQEMARWQKQPRRRRLYWFYPNRSAAHKGSVGGEAGFGRLGRVGWCSGRLFSGPFRVLLAYSRERRVESHSTVPAEKVTSVDTNSITLVGFCANDHELEALPWCLPAGVVGTGVASRCC